MYKLVRTKRVKLLEIKIHEIYAYFQPVLNAIVSRSRRTGNGPYNSPVARQYLEAKNDEESSSYNRKQDYLNSRRESAPLWGNRGVVNFGKMSSYGTVEYRQHQQTYNVATVQNWVKLMHRITSRAWVQETKNIDPANYPVSVDGMSDFLGLGANRLRAWMRRRANHFDYPQLARNEGVNPAIGQRTRQGNNLVNSLSPELREALTEQPAFNPQELPAFNPQELNRLYDAIVLACANHPETYERVKRIYLLSGELPTNSLRAICGDIPNSYLPENYTLRTWDNLNWESIRSEVIEGLAE